MARLIDADALKKAIMAEPWKEQINAVRLTVDYINIIIDEQPTVDAVPVVRCKNCLYYQETIGKDSGKPCGYGSCCVPGHVTGIVYDEEFCSYGERKSYG